MAHDADELGKAAADVASARDRIVEFAGLPLGADLGPIEEAFELVCGTWLHGLDVIAAHTGWVAEYTQDVAEAFGATDQELEDSYTPLYTWDDLPPVIQDPDAPVA
jgi:hypothetical protein